MVNRIIKQYPLGSPLTILSVPTACSILKVGLLNDIAYVWIQVDPDHEADSTLKLRVVNTDEVFTQAELWDLDYLDTLFVNGNALHVFEEA